MRFYLFIWIRCEEFFLLEDSWTFFWPWRQPAAVYGDSRVLRRFEVDGGAAWR